MVVYHRAVLSDPVASKLLEATRELLEDHRLEDVTVRAISERAGVSTINVYTRFGSKDGILDVLHREGYEELRRRFEEIAAATTIDGMSVPDAIRAMAKVYRAFLLQSRSRYRIMFEGSDRGFEASPDAAAASRAAFVPTLDMVQRAVENGETSMPAGTDAIPFVGGLWALVHGAATMELRGTGSAVVGWERAMETTLEHLIASVFPSAD